MENLRVVIVANYLNGEFNFVQLPRFLYPFSSLKYPIEEFSLAIKYALAFKKLALF
jgi:hypothetical protein